MAFFKKGLIMYNYGNFSFSYEESTDKYKEIKNITPEEYAVYYVGNFPKESSDIINDNQKTIANLTCCNGMLRNRICELEKENKFHLDRTDELRRMYAKSETENKELKFSIAGIKDFLSVSDS
jgi:hypothetical protein